MTPPESLTIPAVVPSTTKADTNTAPLCERCGQPKTRRYAGSGGKAPWKCRPCCNQDERDRKAARSAGIPPICECGLPKERLKAGRGHSQYWGCRPCRNRKSLEAYQARKAGGMALSSFKAVEATAIEIEARKAPPKPERPLGTCWREHRDFWAAEHHLCGTTLRAMQAAAAELRVKGGRR